MSQRASTLLLPAARLARAASADVAAAVAAHAGAEFIVIAGDSVVAEVAAAVSRLHAASPDGPTVRLPSLDASALPALRAAGAAAIEWPVLAPTAEAAAALPEHGHEPALLRLAMAAAKELGLHVRLNWQITRQTTPALVSLPAWPETEVVLLPWLGEDAQQVPLLFEARRHWPAEPRVPLVRSALWPACLEVDAQAGAPVPPSELARHGVALQPACAHCPHAAAHRCPGIAKALLGALATAQQPFQGWQHPPVQISHARPAAPEPLHFDAACVEVRGLLLGLRAAWRLTLPHAALPALKQTVVPLGLAVEVWPQPVRAHAGAAFMPAEAQDPGAVALVVVARDPALATACLQDEMSLTTWQQDDAPAARAAQADTHRRIGAAYGYPACCVDAFCAAHCESFPRVWDADDAHWVARAHAASARFDARLSTFAGETGERNTSPLRHFPCRFDCPASIGLADALLADLRTSNPAWFGRHAASKPAPVLAFADGSYLLIEGRCAPSPSGPATRITHILSISGCFLGAGTAAARLRPQIEGVQALDVLPGRGVALQGPDGWREVTLHGPADLARTAAFPLLLPFA